MTLPLLEILYEDNHCIAVAKPAGVPSTHFDGTTETMDRAVKAYLKQKYRKPGNVFLGIVHRLDKPTSGVLLFARTSKAASRIARQFRDGAVEKVYWAVVEGDVKQEAGSLEDWLRKNDRVARSGDRATTDDDDVVARSPDRATPRVEVVSPDAAGARQALLHYRRRASHGGLTWLEVRPQTGRTHQLRVQFAHHGHPIYGDAKYGAVTTFGMAIGLHARALTFLHPVRYDPITLTAEPPRPWFGRFAYLFREGKA